MTTYPSHFFWLKMVGCSCQGHSFCLKVSEKKRKSVCLKIKKYNFSLPTENTTQGFWNSFPWAFFLLPLLILNPLWHRCYSQFEKEHSLQWLYKDSEIYLANTSSLSWCNIGDHIAKIYCQRTILERHKSFNRAKYSIYYV